MVTASATVRCLRRASHMAGLSARSCRRLLASSGGRQVLSRHFCVDSRVRACQRHMSTLQDPARHFLGSMVAGNCLFDMPSRRCGQKRHTAPTGATGRQQDAYEHEKANRDYPFFLLLHPLLCIGETYVCNNHMLHETKSSTVWWIFASNVHTLEATNIAKWHQSEM